jgi:hypothetical protein
MDVVCLRTLGGRAARGAKLGAGSHERYGDNDLAGSDSPWRSYLGIGCHYNRNNLCLVWGGDSVPGKSASDRPTFDQLFTPPWRKGFRRLPGSVEPAEVKSTDIGMEKRPLKLSLVSAPMKYRLRTAHWSVARLSTGSKAPDFEFVFAELLALCWNLGYAFVWHLSAFEGDLDP